MIDLYISSVIKPFVSANRGAEVSQHRNKSICFPDLAPYTVQEGGSNDAGWRQSRGCFAWHGALISVRDFIIRERAEATQNNMHRRRPEPPTYPSWLHLPRCSTFSNRFPSAAIVYFSTNICTACPQPFPARWERKARRPSPKSNWACGLGGKTRCISLACRSDPVPSQREKSSVRNKTDTRCQWPEWFGWLPAELKDENQAFLQISQRFLHNGKGIYLDLSLKLLDVLHSLIQHIGGVGLLLLNTIDRSTMSVKEKKTSETDRSTSSHQERFQGGSNAVKWRRNGEERETKWRRNGDERETKWTRNGHETETKWSIPCPCSARALATSSFAH